MVQRSVVERSSHADGNRSRRAAKARQILDLLRQNVGDLRGCEVLDVGTGSGIIASAIAPYCRSLVSVDVVDERAVSDFRYLRIDDEQLPFADRTFDIVITNHVVEHVDDASLHLREVARVLRPTGVAYLAMPNKWSIIEPHFHMPFLSWLPQRLGDVYVRFAHRGTHYDVRPLTFGDLTRHACAADLVLSDQSCRLVDRRLPRGIRIGRNLLEMLHPLFPSYVALLTHRDTRCEGAS